MRILIYEPLPDINRAPFIARLARALQRQGHEVLLALEERLIYTLKGALTGQGVIDCRGVICAFIAADPSLRFTLLPVPNGVYRKVSRANFEDRLRAVAVGRKAHYDRVLGRFRPDLVMIWNGQAEHQQDFMACLSESAGCDVLFLECGWFPQRDYFYWDQLGVNASSSLAGRAPPLLDDAQREQIRAWKRDYTEAYRGAAERRKQILVPLQVDTDSNVTLHSPFASMAEFLRHLDQVVRPDYQVVVRPHPLGNYPYAISSGSENFRIDRHTPLYELIASSEYVIGINSTVLLEALVFDKKVYAFGRGIFDASAAVGSVAPGESLPPLGDGSARSADALLFELVFRRQMHVSCQGLPRLAPRGRSAETGPGDEGCSHWRDEQPPFGRLAICWSRLKYRALRRLARSS